MRADIHQIKSDLKACKIKEIFSQELGWDTLPKAPPETFYQGQKYVFTPIAQKKVLKSTNILSKGAFLRNRFSSKLIGH